MPIQSAFTLTPKLVYNSLANMIIIGKILKVLEDFGEDSVKAALNKVISAKHADMLDVNLKAMQIGADYEA